MFMCKPSRWRALGLLAASVLGTSLAAPCRATMIADFNADSISTTGAVTTWMSSVNTYTVSTDQAGTTLVQSDFNGHKGVRFNGSSSLSSQDGTNNPLAGANDFSIVTVFRTQTVGIGGTSNWYNNAGIVDEEIPGNADDWGTVMTSVGRLGAGLGNPDRTAYAPNNEADGQIHVMTYTRSGGVIKVYVDGALASTDTFGGSNARASSAFEIGRLASGGLTNFTGDIAEIQFYNTALDAATVSTTSSSLTSVFVPEPMSGGLILGLGVAGLLRRRRAATAV